MQNDPNNLAIGLDIGGTDTKAVIVDGAGTKLHESVEPTALADGRDMQQIIARLRERVDRLKSSMGRPVEYIGVAIPGMASRDERRAAWLPKDKLDLQGVDFAESLGWSRPVPALNDAHAALLGEVWHGAAAGRRDVVMLTLGTGVGGATLCDGKLIRGTMGRAGHLGHIGIGNGSPPSVCNMPGSLEQAIGDVGVARRSGGRFTKTRQLVEAAANGDADAARVWDQSLKDLAYGIASFINIFDPEMIVISGGIAKAGVALFEPLKTYLAKIEWKPTGTSVPIVPAALGEWAGAIGAASRALGAVG